MERPDAPTLLGPRVRLEPLRVEHAREMAPLLDDPQLHAFIGGRPAGLAELEERYRRQAAGRSADGTQRWLNWVVRRLDDEGAVGTVQATVADEAGALTAAVAWVIATPYQGRGYAREAAAVMVEWLRRSGVARVVAHIHPRHAASAAVARAVGLAPTEVVVDGEIRWES
jgi:RimJ/RimL family protein N-acetyltransferase